MIDRIRKALANLTADPRVNAEITATVVYDPIAPAGRHASAQTKTLVIGAPAYVGAHRAN